MRAAGSFAIDFGVRATRKSRAEAAAVTGSRVCADSIVAIRTWKGSSRWSLAIFSTAGSSSPSIAFASRRMTVATGAGFIFTAGDFVPRNPLTPSLAGAPGPAPAAHSLCSFAHVRSLHRRERLVAVQDGEHVAHREVRHRSARLARRAA